MRITGATLTMLNNLHLQSLTMEIANGRYRKSAFSRDKNSG